MEGYMTVVQWLIWGIQQLPAFFGVVTSNPFFFFVALFLFLDVVYISIKALPVREKKD
jgi:hypothetical protein